MDSAADLHSREKLNMRNIFYSVILFLIPSFLIANDTIPHNDTLPIDDPVDFKFEANFDSLLAVYYINQSLEQQIDDSGFETNDSLVPDFSDSVYIRRLAEIPTVIDLTYNRLVKNYINVYTKKRREQVRMMLGLSDYYFPMFEEVFDLYGVPYELKYLAIIESALNPRAVSKAGAVGSWQFMYRTGKAYGLTVNSLVDERRDPLKATHSAARFLRDLYGIYGDWTLALAAYNCGPGNVNKAIRRSGGKRNFWDIYYYLPKETRGYVPAFIAATYTMTYYKEHNLAKKSVEISMHTDTLMIYEQLHLKQVSEVLDIPIKELRDLNPQYRYDIVPATSKRPYALTIPLVNSSAFIEFQDSILTYNDSVFFNNENLIASPRHASSGFQADLPVDKYDKLYYTIRSGDNLGFISDWYNVRIADLRYWNNISRNIIRSGQKLVIYKPKGKAAKYSGLNTMSFNEKQKFAGRKVQQISTPVSSSPVSSDSGDYVYYTVKSGDTLWDISRLYPGVSDTDIIRLNGFSNGNSIKPGQKIKIKLKG